MPAPRAWSGRRSSWRAQAARRTAARPEQHGCDRAGKPGGERERGARDGVAARRQYEHRVAERHDARHAALARRGAGPWVSKLVSVGNEADIGVGELVELLAATRPRASSSFSRDGARRRASARAARKAHAAGKAIVAYKLGRSTLGEKAALSHTGALAGTDAALDAYFRDCGIVRVDMLETLLEIAPLLAGRKPPDLSRPGKVFVVTTTGGGAASVVDRLGMHGVELAAPIMDLTMAGTGRNYADALEKGARTDCDAVVACVGSSAQFHPDIAVEPIIRSPKVKPVVAFFTPQADRSLALAAAHGIPAFRTPEACADALAAFFSWRSPRAAYAWHPAPCRISRSSSSPISASGCALGDRRAPDFAHRIAYPVAVKTLEAHKTERGGVILGVANDAELRHKAAALGNRVLVQRMERGLLKRSSGTAAIRSLGRWCWSAWAA